MKIFIFAALVCLISSAEISAQDLTFMQPDIQTITDNILEEFNKWDEKDKSTEPMDTKEAEDVTVIKPTYDLYIATHNLYLWKEISLPGKDYKTIVDSLTPSLDTDATVTEIRNPLDVYITLSALYVYSHYISANIPKILKDQTKRAKKMENYIEKRMNDYQSIFDNQLKTYIKAKELISEENVKSKEYKKEMADVISEFKMSKERIEVKAVNLINDLNTKLKKATQQPL